MIAFIVLIVLFAIWVTFCDDGIVDCFRQTVAGEKTIRELLGDLSITFILSICIVAIIAGSLYIVSALAFGGAAAICPEETSYWEFNINALNDNVVTEGKWYGRRGSVDGELSYFYCRPLSLGEKIEHIPADKTYVQYSESEHPHIEVHQTRVVIPKWLSKLLWVDMFNTKQTDYYILVVPEGTITTTGQYEIDMG